MVAKRLKMLDHASEGTAFKPASTLHVQRLEAPTEAPVTDSRAATDSGFVRPPRSDGFR